MKKRNFRLSILFLMITFSIFISLFVVFVNQENLQEEVIEKHEIRLSIIEDTVLNALDTIDTAYQLFDSNISNEMKNHSETLLEHYQENPNVETWDFDALKAEFGMDVYVIDDTNTVIHSSFQEDIGLDFQACCTGFSEVLDERRNGSTFVVDGMDVQQKTGEIKKFSYVPTPDHHYLLQLGYALQDNEIFNEFNIWNLAADLEDTFGFLHTVQIRNSEGYLMGEELESEWSTAQMEAFDQALQTNTAKEVEGTWNDELATYRYIPYEANEERGISTKRMVEIIYHEDELQQDLSSIRNQLFMQLLTIVVGAVIITYVIFKRFAKPMHLAFHDSLTGLKNRAAFEDISQKELKRKDQQTALMMIDLDNFKLTNDTLGHNIGDELLITVAKIIRQCVGKENIPTRLGGDEFVVILPNSNIDDATQIATQILDETNQKLRSLYSYGSVHVTLSIGIALSEKEDTVVTLYEKADKALYTAKNSGKNQFQFYQDVG